MKATRSAHTRCIRVAGSHSGNHRRPLPVEALRGLLLRGAPAVPRCVVGFWTWCRRRSSPAPGRERVGTAGCERDGNGTERERRPGRAAARAPDIRRVAPRSLPNGVALARRRGDTARGHGSGGSRRNGGRRQSYRSRPGRRRRGRRCGRPGRGGRVGPSGSPGSSGCVGPFGYVGSSEPPGPSGCLGEAGCRGAAAGGRG